MFSGIHSLIFGKKHKHKHDQDDGTEEQMPQSSDSDFVILERRHSGDFDKHSTLYPSLDPSNPSSSNLPYIVSPSLPNLNEATSGTSPKEEGKMDMLQAVSFVLSSQLLLLDKNSNKRVDRIIESLNDFKESGEENLFGDFTYDFELEHSVLSDYS